MRRFPYRAFLPAFFCFLGIFLFCSLAWSAQIKIAWDANTESDLAGYKVYYGTASRSYGSPTSVAKDITTHTITGLTAGQTYYIAVTAIDNASPANESGYSIEVSGAATDSLQTYTYTLTTSPSGLQVVVDQATYVAPTSFTWSAGSSHTISVSSPQSGSTGTRYTFLSWSDGGAQTHTITAPSANTTYSANLATQYSLTTAANPSGAGTVSPSGTNWYSSGQSVPVSATATTGYTFANWSGDLTGSSASGTVVMGGPKSTTANFNQIQYTVTTNISPSNAGSVSRNPNKSTYAYGEQVTLTAAPNTGYNFANWSGDATGTANPVAVTMNGNKTVTATFSAIAETVSAPTTPSGTGSGVTGTAYGYSTGGGSSNLGHSLEYQFDWKGDGTDLSAWGAATQSKTWSVAGTYSVKARARCATHTGVSSSWSNALTVAMTQATVPVTIATSPSGLSVTVDGSGYTAPRTFNWAPGSSHTVAVSTPQSGTSGTRYVFASWSDAGAASHSITTPSSTAAYTANFTTQHTLTTSASPTGGGTVNPSGTNWFDSGAAASLIPTPTVEFYFTGWSGDLTGPSNPGSLTMNGPKNVVANFSLSSETVSAPTTPSGSSTSEPGASHAYTTGGAASSLGHSVAYQFDWKGDETDLSTWGSATQSKTWAASGAFNVRARARCTTHTNAVSAWSSPLAVNVTQSQVSYVVATDPPGLDITVDGSAYTAPRTFTWTPGTTHTVSALSPQGATPGVRYLYASWSDGGGQTHTITVPLASQLTAAASSACTATFTPEYSVTTSVNPPGAGSVTPSGTNWYRGQQVLSVSAAPVSGYYFSGWSGDFASSMNPASITVDGPKNVVANFSASEVLSVPSAPVGPATGTPGVAQTYSTGSSTSNLGHSVLYQFDWKGDGTDLSEWGPVTQSKTWVSVGTYNVKARSRCAICAGVYSLWSSPLVVTVDTGGIPSVACTFTTNPSGLKITVDGTNFTTPKTFNWAPNSSHTLSVPSPQSGRVGTQYVFASWSNGEAQAQTITVPSAGTTYTASFETQHSLDTSINIIEAGGVSPRGLNWFRKGDVVPVSAAGAPGYYFSGWSGSLRGTQNPASLTMDGPRRVRANFKQEKYTIQVSGVTSTSGAVSKSPQKSRYVYGEQVTMTAMPKAGYSFTGWSGDITGYDNPLTFTVKKNMSLRPNFEKTGSEQTASAKMEPLASEEPLPFVGQLEYPADGKAVSGVRALYGWALDEDGVTKVELFVDGDYVCDIPYGGKREAIREAYPGYPEAAESGFAMVMNYSGLPAGERLIEVRIHNASGESLGLKARVLVQKFHGEVVTQTNPGEWLIPGVDITVDGVTKMYDLRLMWSEESQAFEISEIVGK